MKRQRGQSMVEFAAGASVLALVTLGTLAIGGLQELDRRTVLAARQTAWQQHWSPAGFDMAHQARTLHAAQFADVQVRDPAGAALLVEEEQLALAPAGASVGGVAGTSTELMLAPLRVVGGFLGGSFDLREKGYAQGIVQARVEPITTLPAPFDELDLTLQSGYALLIDGWHAGGIRHVASRAGGLVPTDSLRALDGIWRPLSTVIGIVEPSIRRLCFGLVEPDRIPEDRLGPGSTPLPGACP